MNRPLDDLTQARVAAEAEAVEELIELIQGGLAVLAQSAVLRAEVNACTADERRQAINTTLALATVQLEASVSPDDPNFKWLVSCGLKDVDALHVLAATQGGYVLRHDRRWYNQEGRDHQTTVWTACAVAHSSCDRGEKWLG